METFLALGGNDGCQPAIVQPITDAVYVIHFRRWVLELGQQHVYAIEDDPLSTDFLFFRGEHGQHSGQIEVARFDDFA